MNELMRWEGTVEGERVVVEMPFVIRKTKDGHNAQFFTAGFRFTGYKLPKMKRNKVEE